MAYTELGAVNLALQRIGVKAITQTDWDTPATEQAINAKAVWEYIRDEVNEEKDWKFAKTRVFLGAGSETDTATKLGFDYAYQLPTDFLRLAKENKSSTKYDPSVYPQTYDYKIEIINGTPNDIKILLTDYDNSNDDLYIIYIKKQDDISLWSPMAISALAFRLAAELAIKRTEGKEKFSGMMQLYNSWLSKADGINQSYDYEENETGSTSWRDAGR